MAPASVFVMFKCGANTIAMNSSAAACNVVLRAMRVALLECLATPSIAASVLLV